VGKVVWLFSLLLLGFFVPVLLLMISNFGHNEKLFRQLSTTCYGTVVMDTAKTHFES